MKKLFTLLTLLVTVATGVWGQTYTNEAATVTWAFTSHEDLTSTNVPADAFLTTNFSKGSNLQDLTTFSTKNCKAGWAEQTLVYFKPVATVSKGAADAAENMLEWTITPATGITFTPENVSVTACTAGGTGDPQLTIYAVYSDNSKETVQSQTNPRRPDKTDQGDGPSVYTKTLTNAKNGTFKVRVYLAGLTNTGKGMAVTNIVVTGKVSGTPVATTTYTITAATSNASLGAATGTATVPENEEVKLTATPTVAGSFVKWQKDGVDFDGNTANPLTVTATADATYTAIFEAKKAITFDKGEGTGTAPATDYALSGEDYTIPESFFLYKTGATLTGWNDGVNTYAPGATISNVTEDIALTAVFVDNTVALGDAAATVNWTFDRSSGAPTLNCENSEMDYVQHTTISGTRFDAVMHVNTLKNAVIDSKTGKLNNTNSSSNAQVNAATKFTIPVVKGAVITYNGTNGTAAAGDITFGGNNGSVSGAVTTYTFTGGTGMLDIIDTKGGFYPSGISVTYPEPQTKYTTPTIVVGEFNFGTHAYPVTITASEGTLEVSTDGTNYTEQESPYQVDVTTTTHFYAKATGSSYNDSDVADENVGNAFDGAKKYVAWVYESNYANKPSNYNIANDAIHTALGNTYNVVNVDIKDYKSAITDEQKTALNGNLDDADLVVISEAVAGNGKGTIALKDLVGTVPMLSMKFFSYMDGRWSWGTPKNAGQATVAITPASKVYKVLEGVTFTGDDVELFSYPNEQNHIQYVESWTSEPAGDVVLATTGSYPAMHASTSQKYFALGLSCDDFTKYNENTVTIVKNAAAMLIAGENLDATLPVPVTITDAEYATYVNTEHALDFSETGITVYTATAGTTKVTLNEIAGGKVPANTPVVLYKANADGTAINVPVIASADAVGSNDLEVSNGSDNLNGKYVLANKTQGVGFYKWGGTTIPAGKVYLNVSAASAPEFLGFGSETTGISAVQNAQSTMSNEVYNLNGQRVAQPTKGLYITNGRKVVVK